MDTDTEEEKEGEDNNTKMEAEYRRGGRVNCDVLTRCY